MCFFQANSLFIYLFFYVSIHLRKCKNLQPPFIFPENVEQSKGAKLYVHIHINFFIFVVLMLFVIEL